MSAAPFREQAWWSLWLHREPGSEELGLCSESPSPGLPWVGLRWGLGAVSSLPQPPAGLFCFPPSPCLCLFPDPLACRLAVCLSLVVCFAPA